MAKLTLHIPTEQYGFVEVETEGWKGSKELYDTIKEEFKVKEGLPRLEWNKLLDKYLNTATMESEEYNSLSPEQQNIIQELKKAFKRINK